jgi:hypothetical protein
VPKGGVSSTQEGTAEVPVHIGDIQMGAFELLFSHLRRLSYVRRGKGSLEPVQGAENFPGFCCSGIDHPGV